MIEALKKNWLLVVVIVAVVWVARTKGEEIRMQSSPMEPEMGITESRMGADGVLSKMVAPAPDMGVPPVSSETRLVIAQTSLSLVVKDVSVALKNAEDIAKKMGGYMVDSNLTRPEGASYGRISIRVPEEKRAVAVDELRTMAVKIVAEHMSGYDVTDQYVDLEARLKVLEQTKAKFEGILSSASRIEDILGVQRELVNLQAQIDAIVGQQKYLEQSAKLSRIDVDLSTDELALPYAPDKVFRPGVVWKLAVRAMLGTVNEIASGLIWVVVYAPLWLPILGLVWWGKRRK